MKKHLPPQTKFQPSQSAQAKPNLVVPQPQRLMPPPPPNPLQGRFIQQKPAPPVPPMRQPSVPCLTAATPRVVQRMIDERQKNLQLLDEYLKGQFGATELAADDEWAESDDFDASYTEVPPGYRPAAKAAKTLWKTVYGAAKPSTRYSGWDRIKCDELCGNKIYIERKTKKEDGTNKRPPLCHIVSFNHIKWAVDYIKLNVKNYTGPDWNNMDRDLASDIVWHASNLRPGHAKCNSSTAHQAVGNPKTPTDEKAAANYVYNRLSSLRPHWF
jgi:hypothetical protein